jgi:hypothetical protein
MASAIQDSIAFVPDYSTALRAVGYDLEALGVEGFDLCLEGLNYVVQIESQKSKKPEIKDKARRALRRLLHTAPTAPTGLLVYTPEDIKRLEHEGQQRRQAGNNPDPHSLPQS